MERRPSLIELPITGTTELIANRTDLNPSASAREDTAVFTERIETNIADIDEISVVIAFFSILIIPLRFSSFLILEQIPRARKQFVMGTKINSDM